MIDPLKSPLLTDIYQLTMLEAYREHGMTEVAAFELFVRRLPPRRSFFLAAGLEQVLDFLENLHFTEEEVECICKSGKFNAQLAEYLAKFRFTGDVYAMPEGTLFFPREPFLRVIAPIPEAQLIETRLINILHFQTLIATKALRCVLAAKDKFLVDFGLRRSHGAEAGLFAARASYIAGFAGTSNVLAASLFDIPAFGTMAHSFVQAHESEELAFEHFATTHPGNVTLLIDTYDTEVAARKVVQLAPKLAMRSIHIKAVRLDSGDLAEHSRLVRRILDDGGLRDVRIFASGGVDEYAIRDVGACEAPIDGFGVGASLDTSSDVPFLDCAYKLVEYAGRPRRKRSQDKVTLPGRKQVYRHFAATGMMERDTLTLESDPHEGEPLLRLVMRAGRRIETPETLDTIRKRVDTAVTRLPVDLSHLENVSTYPVIQSPALMKLVTSMDEQDHRM